MKIIRSLDRFSRQIIVAFEIARKCFLYRLLFTHVLGGDEEANWGNWGAMAE